jgi:hypothetical protein
LASYTIRRVAGCLFNAGSARFLKEVFIMSDQNTNDFEGREGVSGEAPPTQPAGDAGDRPTGERPEGDGKEQATGSSKPGSADDFRDSLSNLSAALDRFGHAAEARARQEWAQGKPEINRATDEIRKGVEGLVRKSSEAVDALSRKLAREEKASPTGEATVSEAPNSGEATPASEEPEHPSTNGTVPQ